MPVAQQRSRIGRSRRDRIGDPRCVEACAGPHPSGRGVVDHQHPHRTVALRLQDEAALEFQGGAQEDREHYRLAHQLCHGDRIAVARQDGIDGRPEAGEPAAQIERLDLKGRMVSSADVSDGARVGTSGLRWGMIDKI